MSNSLSPSIPSITRLMAIAQHKEIHPSAIPTEAYSKVSPGLSIPYPSGYLWRCLVKRGSRKHRRANHADIDENEQALG